MRLFPIPLLVIAYLLVEIACLIAIGSEIGQFIERRRAEEARLNALADLYDAEMAVGRHAEAVGELKARMDRDSVKSEE